MHAKLICTPWSLSLDHTTLDVGELDQHGATICQATFATLPFSRDKRLQTATHRVLQLALKHQPFLKQFASYYCKALTSDKSGTLTATPGQVLILIVWSASILNALECQATLSSAANQKVLQVAAAAAATLVLPPGHPEALKSCIHRLNRCFHRCPNAAKAAAAVATSKPPTAASGVAAAALLDTHIGTAELRAPLVAAYVDGIVGAKERLPDAITHAWTTAAARLTAQEAEPAIDKFILMAKRSAETALANLRGLFAASGAADFSPLGPHAAAAVVPLLRHSKEAVVDAAVATMAELSARLRCIDELFAAVCTVVVVLDGCTGGPALKSTKDRAVFIKVVLLMCPDASDRHLLRRLIGDVRTVFLRMAERLVAVAKCEVTSDGKVGALSAARAWALAGAMHDLYGTALNAHSASAPAAVAAAAVASALAEMANSTDAEVRRAVLTVSAALAVDISLGASLAPLQAAAEASVRDGAGKVALRTEGIAGLAVSGAIAASGETCSWELFTGSSSNGNAPPPAVQLLQPAVLATVGAFGVYAAAAAAAAAPVAAAVDTEVMMMALAALLLGNAALPRAAALQVTHQALTMHPRLATPLLSSLVTLVDTYPDIPTARGPAPSPGEPPPSTGARILSPRILASAALLCPIASEDPHLAAQLLTLLHHPVALGLRCSRSAGAAVRRLLHRCGLTSPPLLATCAMTIGGRLSLSAAPPAAHSHTAHLAAQDTLASCVVLSPESVWPVCMQLLRQLMDSRELEELVENDIRIFQTPRGCLMVEEFGSQLSPDELFAIGSRQISAMASEVVMSADGSGKKGRSEGTKGGKKGVISKEEQQRQDQLATEVRYASMFCNVFEFCMCMMKYPGSLGGGGEVCNH
jgi:hypothetical protein